MSHRTLAGKGITAAAAVALLSAAMPLAAQSSPSYPANRFHHQQQRINQGLKSGQMTKAEYARSEAHLKAVEQQRKAYLATHNGKMSSSERAKLNRQLNANSNRVYFQKHNVTTRPGTEPVAHRDLSKLPSNTNSKAYINDRITRQMDQIRNGVASGQITRGEYNTDIQRLRNIQAQEGRWLSAQHGTLTETQKDQLNRQLENEFHRINMTKHNSPDQPGV